MSKSISEDIFLCEVCGKGYYHRRSLQQHIKKDHKTLSVKKNRFSSFICQLCEKNFGYLGSLKRHVQTVHGDSSVYEEHFNCMLCTFKFISKKSWLDHIESVHKIPIKSNDLRFATHDKFLKWKEEIEKNTCSKFIKRKGAATVNGKLTQYYSCRRSGYFISKSEGIRRLRATGSIKMNGKCPAEIKVVVWEDGTCTVRFVSTHVGHQHQSNPHQLQDITESDKLGIDVLDASIESEIEVILDEVTRNLCSKDPLLSLPQLQNTVSEPGDIGVKDPSTVNKLDLILDKVNGNLCSNDPSLVSPQLQTTTVSDPVAVCVEDPSIINGIEVIMDKVNGNLCSKEPLLNPPKLQTTTVSNPVATSVTDPSIPNEAEVTLGDVNGSQFSNNPRSLSDEKKTLISMFSDIISGMASSEVHLAKEMVLSLDAALTALRLKSCAWLRKPELTPNREVFQRRQLSPKEKKTVHGRLTGPYILQINESQYILSEEGLNPKLFFVLEQCDNIGSLSQPQHTTRELNKENNVTLEHCYALPYQPQEIHSSPG